MQTTVKDTIIHTTNGNLKMTEHANEAELGDSDIVHNGIDRFQSGNERKV